MKRYYFFIVEIIIESVNDKYRCQIRKLSSPWWRVITFFKKKYK